MAKNKQDAIDLEALNEKIGLQEKSLASEMKKQEIMKQGGVHWKVRREHAKALIDLQDEIVEQQQKQSSLQAEINVKAEKQASIGKGFMGILGAINELVNKALELLSDQNDLTRGTADNLNVSVTEAMALNKEFTSLAVQSGGTFNTQELIGNFKLLRDEIGDSSIATKEVAVSMTEVQKSLNISGPQAAMFYKQIMLSDGASAEVAKNTLLLGKNLADASGVNFQNVMADVEKSGKNFQNHFGKSTKVMLKAAVAARKMGFELADMVSMATGLMDVEGRIEKQMKVNMLTGKQINLDKATSLMMNDNELGAMEEVKKQIGDTSELRGFERQQMEEFLQSTMGFGLMELEQSNMKAEKTTLEGEKQTQAMIDMDNLNLKTATQIDQANAMVTSYEKGANAVKNQKDFMMALTANTVDGSGAAENLMRIQQALAVVQTLVAVAGIFSAFAQIPFGIGIPLGIAAIAGMMALMSQIPSQVGSVADGQFDQEGLMVSSPKGTYELDKNDKLIAGTFDKKSSPTKQEPMSPVNGAVGGNMNALKEELSHISAKLSKLIEVTKGGKTVSVDGYQLNEAVHLEKIGSGLA